MNIYTYLKKDHAKVAKLFKLIIAAEKQKERESIFLQLKQELELHSDPEHSTFYQALKKSSSGAEEAAHGDEEHDKIKKLLTKLSKFPVGSPTQWLVQLGALKYIVEHHVEDEEKTMFPEGEAVISATEAETLAVKMDELKEKMKKSKSFQNKFKKIKK
jgi:hypothetical protein